MLPVRELREMRVVFAEGGDQMSPVQDRAVEGAPGMRKMRMVIARTSRLDVFCGKAAKKRDT